MLTLYASPTSPFVRKTRIAASVLNLDSRIRVEMTDIGEENEELREKNPLFKIPTLLLEDGVALFDSCVIVEYLDFMAGGGILIPRDDKKKFIALRQQALADGISDAAVLIVYEKRFRAPENYDQGWVDRQWAKVEFGLAFAERLLSTPEEAIHVGHIALACTLGFLDLRFDGAWRKKYPKLVKWLAAFEKQIPAYAQTAV